MMIFIKIYKSLLNVHIREIKQTHEDFIPHVIEPSFGIDRLMYSILEHNFEIRPEDKKRSVLQLSRFVVPYDVAIFALHSKPELIEYVEKIRDLLAENNFDCYIDDSVVSIWQKNM